MATRHTHTDAVGTTGAKATVETPQPDENIETLRVNFARGDAELRGAKEQLTNTQRMLESERSAHKQEMQRMTEMVEHLQKREHGSTPMTAMQRPTTPETALRMIITHLEAVAVGGAATDLRQAVATSVVLLSRTEKVKLAEYVSRLRGAAEAVDQEMPPLTM